MRFSLRTLLIVMLLGGPALAGVWWVVQAVGGAAACFLLVAAAVGAWVGAMAAGDFAPPQEEAAEEPQETEEPTSRASLMVQLVAGLALAALFYGLSLPPVQFPPSSLATTSPRHHRGTRYGTKPQMKEAYVRRHLPRF